MTYAHGFNKEPTRRVFDAAFREFGNMG